MKMLQSKNVISAIWVFGGYGATQCIRLLSNLILTRLLIPEMFGLMVLVNAVLIGVSLLSDVGIRDSIINTKGESKDRFLHTAWTLQILRGLFIFAFVFVMAPFVESYFEYDQLTELLRVCAVSAVITSFSSLNKFVLEKKLEFRPQICIEIGANSLGVIVMVVTAYFYQNVWSLVVGTMVQSMTNMVLTHTVLPGQRMKLCMDMVSAKKIIHLGKWIMLSTAAMYATTQGDKLLLAKMISPYELGVYSVAAIFGYVLKDVIANMSNKMLMPVYRQVVEQGGDLQRIVKARMSLLTAAFLGALLLSIFGELIIELLYDERYADAGWILQLLAFAGLCHSFDDTVRGFLVANRDSFHGFCVQALKGSVFIFIAYFLSSEFGIVGMLIAMAVTPLLTLPYLMYVVAKHGYRWFYIDFFALLFVSVCFLNIWALQDGMLWNNLLRLVVAL